MSKQRLSKHQWRELVDEQRASGLSVDAFCKQHGLASSTFFNWARRFKTATPSAAAQAGHGAADFVELVAPPASPTAEVDASTTVPTPIELVLPSRLVLRVRHGFDPRMLKQVVEALV